ncbi:hypothetical protein H6F44_10295 [Pseudanabaena sp. FACHB-1277]|uniref:Uncharacterized protein n=1 Tax=Pseudanabaena cinerea FACHB-1277 TaxID=2949581 RepID=A0A926USM3_9CYAN|nr:hypothetical protein [Pseudanabaena cinerea]MBD2150506.1 hypothetical protein [Pseudanabaena cinerea FACHB-1277]
MITITPTLEIPPEIAEGLANEIYYRVGGVIREVAGTKPIVAWLREVPNTSGSNLLTIANIGSSASILNLGISVMGFALVLHKLKDLEERLQKIQKTLEKVDRKIDLGFYANFRAALDLATNAFSMNQSENRKNMAVQAINRFLEAEHIYLDYTDKELEQRSKLVHEYLLTLSLAYIAEARCHLELEESDMAVQRLEAGFRVISDRLRKYLDILLTSNPAAYLHPKFKNEIGLGRLTKVYQWIDPSLDAAAVFEMQRDNIFSLKKDQGSDSGYKWVNKLPQAIVAESEVQWDIWGNREQMKKEAMSRLPKVFANMESMIETIQRFEAYQSEVKAISKLGISFREWTLLAPVDKQQSENRTLMYLVPSRPVEA